ncbi:hypothetical protein BJF82_12475 [Kytococcus sp. CUA-901]|nr:hypothetical protein BJF82_12475 [Kytococcus sp. CUA-901]
MLWASPFSIGFTGALGVLLAWLLVQNLTRLSSVLTYLLVAVFLTLALNPLVEGLTRRGVSRPSSVFVVFMGFVTVVAVSAVTLLPGVVAQAVTLVERAPQVVEELAGSPWLVELDARYAVSERATTELDRLLTERGTWTTLFGGVLGAAGWVAGSLVGVLTSAILTLYLLATPARGQGRGSTASCLPAAAPASCGWRRRSCAASGGMPSARPPSRPSTRSARG